MPALKYRSTSGVTAFYAARASCNTINSIYDMFDGMDVQQIIIVNK